MTLAKAAAAPQHISMLSHSPKHEATCCRLENGTSSFKG
jgi:hypothetical protein